MEEKNKYPLNKSLITRFSRISQFICIHELITKFIVTCIFSGLEFLLPNHTSIYKNSKLDVSINIKFVTEIFNN